MSHKRFLKYHLYNRWFGKPTWNAAYLFERAVQRLQPGDIVVDAGANLGDITSTMAATGAIVHAFEPDPYAFEQLHRRVGHLENVRLYRKALSDTAGVARLYRAKTFSDDPALWSQSSSLFADKSNVTTDESIEIEQLGVVEFLRDLDRPVRIMKIDVEGAEVPILEAIISNGLMDRIDRIFAETHEKKIPQLAERTERLRREARARWPDRINLDWH